MNLILTSFMLLFKDKIFDKNANFTVKPSFLQCAQYCVHQYRCRSVFYHEEKKRCVAHEAVLGINDTRLVNIPGYEFYKSNLFYPPHTCSDVRLDNPEAKDGEYSIFPLAEQFQGKAAGIFCVMSVNPPEEYVTLNDRNYGNYPNLQSKGWGCLYHSPFLSGEEARKKTGKVYFKKIRVTPETMAIVRGDTRFCETERENACTFGKSEDCYSQSCGAKGFFCASTKGTGMKLSQKLEWKKFGYKCHDPRIFWYQDGLVLQVNCGGKCGGCDVVGEMLLYPHP